MSDDERGFGAGLTAAEAFLAEDLDDVEWAHHARASRIVTDLNVRCPANVRIHGTDGLSKVCHALLAQRVSRPWTLTCRRCKTTTSREIEG